MDGKQRPVRSRRESKELIDLKINLNITRDFLYLVQHLDKLPDLKRVPYDATRSLFQAVSTGRDIYTIGKELEGFFGFPKKPADRPVPVKMRLHPAIKYLHGLRDDQALYFKKTKNGYYYAALWPWQKKTDNITVHLGYCSSKMSGKNYKKLQMMVKSRALNQKLFDEFERGQGSRVHGISLASFLHMAQLERITCALEVKATDMIGYLHLHDGELVAAEAGAFKNKAAAYQIISWDNTLIEIRDTRGKKTNEIEQPLIEILAEALRVRREGMADGGGLSLAAATQPDGSIDRYQVLREVAEEPKKPHLRYAAAVVAITIILVGGAHAIKNVMQSRQIEKEFQNVLVEVENEVDSEEKKALLLNYIDSHEPSKFTEMAENKIMEIENFVETSAYRTVVSTVARLPLDENYEQAAAELYNRYLDKYPTGVHAEEIRNKIFEVPDLIDDIDYEKLQAAVNLDYDKRIEAYLGYLIKHPKGKHRSRVEALISEMSEEYYAFLIQEIPECDQQKQWDTCIKLCGNFLSYFKDHYLSQEILDLKNELQDKKDLKELLAKARQVGSNFEAAKQIYITYLEKNPNSTQVDRIKDEISQINKQQRKIDAWKSTLTFSKNPEISYAERIHALNLYIRHNPTGFFTKDAKKLQAQLLEEYQTLRQLEIKTERNQELARIEQEKNRIKKERDKVAAKLSLSRGRFTSNGDGTFKDVVTGLTWCLLDSYTVLSGCQDFVAAKQYVENLRTGGYRDWRLPSGSELAGIYKHSPYFPGYGAEWYWTSEVFAKGHHKEALVVTTKRENVFNRQHMELNRCGAVRAVRP
jgi:hypothetical protein